VRSAKPFSHEAGVLENFMEECDGPAYSPLDWCVGIAHDVQGDQFRRPWTRDNPHKCWVQLPDEQTARSLQDYLRGLGLSGDAHGGDPGQPSTQVYVYRHPGRDICFEGEPW